MKIEKNDWKKYGIGSELLPERHLEISKTYKNSKKEWFLSPIKVTTTKDHSELFFRTFSFVDKRALYKLQNYVEENKEIICNFLKKVDSKEKVSQYQICEKRNGESLFLNLIELKAIGKNPSKSFEENLFYNIRRSSVYKYNDNIDISHFYDSIYTHSLEWIEGVELEKLDKYMRGINGNITSGIPTGPIVSKIISEIILTSVMLEVSKQIERFNCHIHRFADDFTIYYNKKEDFIEIVKIIARILNKYKLSINKEKFEKNYTYKNNNFVKINVYENENKWNVIFDWLRLDFDSPKLVIKSIKSKLLNVISSFESQKEKTSFYKWILKTLKSEDFLKCVVEDEQTLELIINFAINYILISDLQLNIPFSFLRYFIKLESIKIKDKTKKDIFKKLKNIYKNTDSVMKKIFIFDFFQENKKEEEFKNILKNIEVDRKDSYLHLAQLLESKIIKFDDCLNMPEPKTSHERISEEWIIWIFAKKKQIKKIKDEKARKALLELLASGEINKYKPFKYQN